MIGCLWTRAHKQPIIALYFESETVLKFYNLEASTKLRIKCHSQEQCIRCSASGESRVNDHLIPNQHSTHETLRSSHFQAIVLLRVNKVVGLFANIYEPWHVISNNVAF